jgi:thymidylate synthase (FAD)
MTAIEPGDKPGELKMFGHGFVRLDSAMADDLSVVNSARVSFAVRKEEMDDRDAGLIKFMMRDRHGSPFEHNSFRFHIRTPIFVAREWFRHRIGCLTGDTVVTFVDTNGVGTSSLTKTIDELWRMWSIGERNGNGISEAKAQEVIHLTAEGLGQRAVSRATGVSRNAVRRILSEGWSPYRSSRKRVQNMRLRVLNEEAGEFQSGHIVDILDKGVQPVYRVTLADGKEITMTENHRVLTSKGWATLREAVGLVGSAEQAFMTKQAAFMTNGRPLYQDREWVARLRRKGAGVQEIADAAGCSYHTVRAWLKRHDLRFTTTETNFPKGHRPWNKDVKGYKIDRRWTEAQKEAIRRARSGPRSNFWRGGVSTDRQSIARWTTEQAPKVHAQYDYTCQAPGCGQRGGKLHAHHIIPVWMDESVAYDIGNLITVCDGCHRAVHKSLATELDFAAQLEGFIGKVKDIEIPATNYRRLGPHPVHVVSVEYVGLEQTYDLCVEGPWHNFVANGMVVHNSFNEESARYHQLEGDFYVPDRAAVRSQVGKPGAYKFEPVAEDLAGETIDTFRRVYKELYAEYLGLVEKGVAKELARSLLPFGIFTQFYWTLNARSLMNFLSLRNAEPAQYEIRVYAEAVERLFAEKMPITYQSFVDFGRRAP